jgi:hypothetical protein
MKIVVIGGSGLIGTKLVNNLRQHGHEVVAASLSSGVNILTGEGLAEALTGAQVVVDVANSPSFEDKPVWSSSRRQGVTSLPRKRPLAWDITLRSRLSAPIAFLRVVTSARGWPKKRRESRPPNQALHMTGAALLVSRDTRVYRRPRQVSFVVGLLEMT